MQLTQEIVRGHGNSHNINTKKRCKKTGEKFDLGISSLALALSPKSLLLSLSLIAQENWGHRSMGQNGSTNLDGSHESLVRDVCPLWD